MTESGWHAPTIGDLERLAAAALATIPPTLARHVAHLPIFILDFPDAETERAMGLDSPFEILGLYHGSGHGADDRPVRSDLDKVFLYRRPILDEWCETGEDLAALVRQVLIHEIGHHFGFSDEHMARIEGE